MPAFFSFRRQLVPFKHRPKKPSQIGLLAH